MHIILIFFYVNGPQHVRVAHVSSVIVINLAKQGYCNHFVCLSVCLSVCFLCVRHTMQYMEHYTEHYDIIS